MKVDASGKITSEILNTLFYDKPVYRNLPNGKKGKIISGTEGLLLYGAFGTGKTLDILTALYFVAQYQKAENGLRKIKVGVVRESNQSFIENFVSKIEMFHPEMGKKTGINGYYVYDATNRAKCKWRFRTTHPDGNGEFKEDGTITEIELHAFSVATESDIKKWKGAEVTIIVFNEMNNYTEDCFDILSARKNRYPFNGADFQFWIGDLNPKLISDWEYRRFIKRDIVGIKVIQYEPPLIWEPNDDGDRTFLGRKGFFVENQEFVPHREDGYAYWHSMTSGTDQSIANNVLGQYYNGSSGTAVHSTFSADRHIRKVEQPKIEDVIVIGVDPGYENGFVTGYFSKVDVMEPVFHNSSEKEKVRKDKFHVMDSYYGDGGFYKTWHSVLFPLLNSREYSEHFEYKRILFIADPRTIKKRSITGGEKSIDVIEDHNFDVAVPADEYGRIIDDIGFRISTIDKYLKEDRLEIDHRNEPLITSFVVGYVTKGAGTEPDKRKSGGFSDVMDALQYVLIFKELGGIISDHIRPLNFSRPGMNKIHNLYYS